MPCRAASAVEREVRSDFSVRNVRKGMTEASIESDGIDVFVVYNRRPHRQAW